jgi:ubiquitin carboxyl-terminal hydrolase 4/11/15
VDYILLPENVWKYLLEWYGGGPEFPRKIISVDQNRNQIELYPPILYAYLCGVEGFESKDTVFTLVLSLKATMKEVLRLMEAKYKKNTQTRIWYRFRNTHNWIQETDLDKTIEGLQLSDGDNLMLEVHGGSILWNKRLEKWPRENVMDKPSSIPNIGDNVDLYIEKV